MTIVEQSRSLSTLSLENSLPDNKIPISGILTVTLERHSARPFEANTDKVLWWPRTGHIDLAGNRPPNTLFVENSLDARPTSSITVVAVKVTAVSVGIVVARVVLVVAAVPRINSSNKSNNSSSSSCRCHICNGNGSSDYRTIARLVVLGKHKT